MGVAITAWKIVWACGFTAVFWYKIVEVNGVNSLSFTLSRAREVR
jgi:hypothetical protein